MNDANGFQVFGTVHLTMLAVIFFIAGIFVGIARRQKSRNSIPIINGFLAIILLSNEGIWIVLAVSLGFWDITWGLPLQLCDLAIFAICYSLFKKNQWVWEIAYFWGLGGTLQALLTPDIQYTFPHYYFFKFFITHGCIVIAVIYLAAGCLRPIYRSSVWRVFVITNIYAFFIGIVNSLIGANYLYLCRKPVQNSLLDYLGPWPYYIFSLEFILAISLIVYYLPYYFFEKKIPAKSS